jgi:hypothetical protein
MSLDVSLKLSQKKFPILFKMKAKERNKLIMDIFTTGYLINFPDTKKQTNEVTCELIDKIDEIRSTSGNTEIIEKMQTFESYLQKLIGLSHSSSKKGEFGENILEQFISDKFCELEYTKTNHIAHAGDAWLTLDANYKIMLESKNYTSKVNEDEIDKMKSDMKTNNIQWGIFISWNSSIIRTQELDIKFFTHSGKTYTILFVSNCSNDINKLVMAIQLVKRLIKNYSNLEEFNWITSAIKSDLEELNSLINHNYILRDNFEKMEKGIKSNLDNFYSELRGYQYKLDEQITKICDNIDNTMTTSIKSNDKKSNITNLLKNFKKNKHFSKLSKLIDLLTTFNLSFVLEGDNIHLQKDDKNIGKVRIQSKKIVLYFDTLNLQLDITTNAESLEVISHLKALI